MSLNPDTLPLPEDLNDFGGISPLCRDYNNYHPSRFNFSRSRSLLQTQSQTFPNQDLTSTESFAESLSLRLSRANLSRNSYTREPESSTLFSKRSARLPFNKTRMGYSPVIVEPESSSSQPNEPSSGTRQTQSPYFSQFRPLKKWEFVFTEEFYRKINDYLDGEGLDFVEPAELMQGFTQIVFSKASRSTTRGDDDSSLDEPQVEVKVIKSANQSPRLVSDQLFTSTLFQRRASRSQGPGKELGIQKPLGQPRPENLRVFKHFKDDINNLLQVTSPIEESFTPALSRNDSEFLEKDSSPDRLGPKRLSFRQLMSPSQDSDTIEDPRSNLMKYTMNKHSRNFKSPHMEISRLGSMNSLTSPIHRMKEAKTAASLRSSPNNEESKVLRKSTQVLSGTPRRHGAVIKKSQFKKVYELEEYTPLN